MRGFDRTELFAIDANASAVDRIEGAARTGSSGPSGEVERQNRPFGRTFPKVHRFRVVVLIAAAAAILTIVATSNGPGITVDSVDYLTGGANLAQGRGITTVDGSTITVFPPALSAVAALGETLFGSPQWAVRILLVLCSAAVVLLGHLLLARLPIGERMLLGSTVLLGLSPTVLTVSSLALSESPFIVVTLGYLVVLGRVVRERRLSLATAAALCGLSSLGFLVRYTGVSLIATTVIVCAAALRPFTRSTVARIASLAAASCVIPGLWVLRNISVDGTLLGPRSPSPDSPLAVPARFVGTVGKWVVPMEQKLPNVVLGLIGLAWCAIVAVGIAAAWRRTGSGTGTGARRSLVDGLGPAVVFTVCYSLQLALSQVTTALDVIGPRLLAPVFVPVLMVSAVAVSALAAQLGERPARSRILAVGSAGLVALLVVHIGFGLNDTAFGARDGIEFNSRRLIDSQLATATEEALAQGDAQLYTNNVPGMWVGTERLLIGWSPRHTGQRGVPLTGDLERFATEVACSARPTLLALYDDGSPSTYTSDDIGAAVQLTAIATTDDGTLYRVTADRPGAVTDCPSA